MRAAVYRNRGPAAEVLRIEELPRPDPGPGELRVKVAFSGVNPSDVKTRGGVAGGAPDWPLVVPHSDGAGVVDALGTGTTGFSVGDRVWVYNAQWGRAFGTAAQYVCLPAVQVVPLPEGVPFEVGASVGIPLMTAFHAVAACGSLLGRSALVAGAAGSVGGYALQLAKLAGATAIATVSSDEKAALARELGADAVLNYRSDDLGARVREATRGRGVDAVIEVDAAANAARWSECLAFGGQVVVYGSGRPEIGVPFRPAINGFARLYFFIVYRLPEPLLRQTIDGVHGLLARAALRHPATAVYPLEDIAAAHERVERGANAKVLVAP